MTLVVNSGLLISLARIGRLDLLPALGVREIHLSSLLCDDARRLVGEL